MSEVSKSAWRMNKAPGWHEDVGYEFQDVLGDHNYNYEAKETGLRDPGWHECSCGSWEGYWSGFHEHVADELRAIHEERVKLHKELMTAFWLYSDWRYVTRNLSTEERELWADVLDADHRAQDEEEGSLGTSRAYSPVERWWRE